VKGVGLITQGFALGRRAVDELVQIRRLLEQLLEQEQQR
jgi:hypothetical protein